MVRLSKARTLPPLKLLKNKFVLYLTLSKVFIDPVWYFITFWIGRYLADTYGWDLSKIGWFAILPFFVADMGNILGGLFTQIIIKRGVPVPKARKIGAGLFGSIMAFSLLISPLVITGPTSALAVLAIAGFGYASLSANLLTFPAEVVPLSATASVWGLASIGSGLGGAIFQSLSGIAVKNLSARYNYFLAYNAVFIGYGLIALTGVALVVFMTGPLVPNREFHEYAEQNEESTSQ
jgi:ACS family hexuronate transporter-like MFS transporter